jgi:ParB family chromosome partitioning protein
MQTVIQDISLAKLVPAAANVRRTNRGVAIEELAASIAAHGLLQNLTVRPVAQNAKGKGGRFEVVAGGRRLAALHLLVKRKALAKSAPIPCHVIEEDAAQEISLAENVNQCPMHPADQYEAFADLHGNHGMAAEDIAARFGVTPAVVKQRLKLGAVSPRLLQAYRDDDMTLDQLTAFTVTDDHVLQELVWDERGWNDSREALVNALNPKAVRADDPRATFVGAEDYEAAGGVINRDLFDDEGGFYAGPQLLNRLAREKLQDAADAIAAEGWKWVQIEPVLDSAMTASLRRIYPQALPLSDAAQARLEELETRFTELSEGEAGEEEDGTPELEQLEREIAELTGEECFAPEVKARAGVIVTLGRDGQPRIERGFVRAEDDERPSARKSQSDPKGDSASDDGASALPDKLVAELTAYRTAGLRNELAQAPDLALAALVHALADATFFHAGTDSSCVQITARSPYLNSYAPGIDATPAMQAIEERHAGWAKRLPSERASLWDFVTGLEPAARSDLLAHCVSLTLDAVQGQGSRRTGKHDHADRLATAIDLDMARYWTATPETFFGRVRKDQILGAVREGVSPQAADNLANLKKPAMAVAAAERLAGKGWLPELLRLPVATAQERSPSDV